MKLTKGMIFGALFGILGVMLASLGLISRVGELFFPLFFPIARLLRGMDFTGILYVATLLNALLFAAVGYGLEYYYEKKYPYIALRVFGGVILLFAIAMGIEYMVSGFSA